MNNKYQMKKVVIFGDSFANMPHAGPNWVEDVANKLSLPFLNYGEAGSALNFSFVNFIRYIRSDHDPDDIIIFIATDSYRVFSVDMPRAGLGVRGTLSDPDSKNEWVIENGAVACEYIEKVYHPRINYELIKALGFLNNWADLNPCNTVIVMRVISDLLDDFPLKDFVPTSNFFPLLNGDLATISESEHVDPANIYLPDLRTNHMSPNNLSIMAQQITDLINTRQITSFDPSKYEKNCYIR